MTMIAKHLSYSRQCTLHVSYYLIPTTWLLFLMRKLSLQNLPKITHNNWQSQNLNLSSYDILPQAPAHGYHMDFLNGITSRAITGESGIILDFTFP